jgi:adenylylsulfate kinase
MTMPDGFTIWITGLPGAGKTTLAQCLEERLLERGLNVERLDADEIQSTWFPKLGFSGDDQAGLERFLGHLCKLFCRNGVISISAATSPFVDIRMELRSELGLFIEVYLKCPVPVSEQRDVSEVFLRARQRTSAGSLDPAVTYEEPFNPEVLLETDKATPGECCTQVIRTLEMLGYIPEVSTEEYAPEDEAKITQRLKDLGYL